MQSVWPVLLGLAFLLFTCVLYTLAAHHGRGITIHDRIRESKALRKQYLDALARKKAEQR